MKYHTLQHQYYFQSVPCEIFNQQHFRRKLHFITMLQNKILFKNSRGGRSATSGTADSEQVSKMTLLVLFSEVIAISCITTQTLCWQNTKSVNVVRPHAAKPVL